VKTRSQFVTARCCQVGESFIRLSYGHRLYEFDGQLDAYMTMVETEPPVWRMSARSVNCNSFGASRVPEEFAVTTCPSCGKPLPAVRRRAAARTPKKITVIVDGGYYCYACGERLMGCKCASPERLWEIAPKL